LALREEVGGYYDAIAARTVEEQGGWLSRRRIRIKIPKPRIKIPKPRIRIGNPVKKKLLDSLKIVGGIAGVV
jgi:hypothetical protein